jgi:phosphoglycerate dehydrogenase-like enzyme
LGVLGLGAIGEEVAQRAKAWGMTVIGTKRSTEGYGGAADEVFGPEPRRTCSGAAEVVVSVLPEGAETDGIVITGDARVAGRLVRQRGRGNVVSEDDILAAIESGGLRARDSTCSRPNRCRRRHRCGAIHES